MNILSLDGRINRLQYLLMSLLPAIIMIVLFVIAVSLGHTVSTHSGDATVAQITRDIQLHKNVSYSASSSWASNTAGGSVFALACLILGLVLAWIGLAAQVKRFHDMGQSGWFVLLNLIPGAGFFVWLVLIVAAGQSGPNAYGRQPA